MKSLVGGTFGKYEVKTLLGKGGMGEVYEAYDTDKGRSVALKVLPDEYAADETFRTRFLRESRAAAVLQEPHVIPIHDWGEIDRTLYIDMRLVRGRTLHDMVKTRALKPQRAVDIVRQVASALDAAHKQGLIHRDVKPQNIIVTPDDFAYLVDFGIAEARGDTHLTMAGYQIGSFAYMAPERFRDEPTTSATDIYSLACVLYEALTGKPPFSGGTEQLIAAHLSSDPPRPSARNPRVPAAFDAVIARGMAKHPDDRYGTAGALARAAKRALDRSSQDEEATKEHEHFRRRPDSPQKGPEPISSPDDGDQRLERYVLPTLVAVAAVLVVIVIVLVVAIAVDDKSGPGTTTTVAYPTSGYPTYQEPTYGTTTTTSTYQQPTPETTATQSTYPTAAPTTTRPMRIPSTTPPTQDPEQRLRQIASGDRSYVASRLADLWVPQLSAKRYGTVEGGVPWDLRMALNEHLQLRQTYGARLLWSGDWSTFSERNYWVTVADITFATADGALMWCSNRGFDRDHCIAKIVSTTRGVSGSTAYN